MYMSGDNLFVLGIDHHTSYFQHAVTVLGDMYDLDYSYDRTDTSELFTDFEIYIGDSTDYT